MRALYHSLANVATRHSANAGNFRPAAARVAL
jgi:hypothetical protein